MPKGKKTDNETIYKIMLSMFSTNNFSETARQLELPESTVEKIYKENKDKDEFVKLCEEKKDEFVKNATRIISKASQLLEKRLDTALNSQDELEEIIDQVWKMDKKGFNEAQKRAIVNKIAKMQLNSLSEITTAIGTMYDKRALAKGESTANSKFEVDIKVVE